MYEGSFESAEEDDRPVYLTSIRKDGRLRDDWKHVAGVIAHIEGGIALSRFPQQHADADLPSDDELQPGFVMVGRRRGLEAIAETAGGIIDHGQAFRAWADLVGDDPEALGLFEEAFLGRWDSVTKFAEQLIAESDGSLATDSASELAKELQRSGDVLAVPSRDGGVWMFGAPEKEPGHDEAGADEGGDHA